MSAYATDTKVELFTNNTTSNAALQVVESGLLNCYAFALYLEETGGANSIQYMIEYSPDFESNAKYNMETKATTPWFTRVAWTTIAAGGAAIIQMQETADAIRVSVQSGVSGSPGVVKGWLVKRRLR
jgi:hypothetical protein